MTAYDLVSSVVDRVALRSRLLRLKSLNDVRQNLVAARRETFQAPRISQPVASTLLAEIQQYGVSVQSDLEAILQPRAAAIIRSLVAGGPGSWKWETGRHLLETEDIYLQYPELYHMGLDPYFLDVAENYISEPCYYVGCCLKLERVTSFDGSTRQWHLDIEDDRLFRIIIYLNDVTPGGGTFQYIDQAQASMARPKLGYRSGYVADALMDEFVPESEWRSVTGPAGTLIAFDGTRVFHRVVRPTLAERFSLTITYASRRPRQILRPVRLRRASRKKLLSGLTERQKASVPGARWS